MLLWEASPTQKGVCSKQQRPRALKRSTRLRAVSVKTVGGTGRSEQVPNGGGSSFTAVRRYIHDPSKHLRGYSLYRRPQLEVRFASSARRNGSWSIAGLCGLLRHCCSLWNISIICSCLYSQPRSDEVVALFPLLTAARSGKGRYNVQRCRSSRYW